SAGSPILGARASRSASAHRRATAALFASTRTSAETADPRRDQPSNASASVGSAPRNDGGDGLRENRDVEPDRPVVEVVEIEANEIVEGQVRAAGDLPEPCHAGQDEVALPVPFVEELEVSERQRSRPDEAHLAAQDVDRVRNL